MGECKLVRVYESGMEQKAEWVLWRVRRQWGLWMRTHEGVVVYRGGVERALEVANVVWRNALRGWAKGRVQHGHVKRRSSSVTCQIGQRPYKRKQACETQQEVATGYGSLYSLSLTLCLYFS